MNQTTDISIIRLILGDQLNPNHFWFKELRPDILYVLMEILPEAVYAPHHIQKLISFFAAMRGFATHLRDAGHRVVYIPLDSTENRQSFEENLLQLVKTQHPELLEYQEPDEYRHEVKFRQLESRLRIPVRMVSSEHFYTERNEVGEFFYGKKTLLMESFYRYMRRKHHVLMEGDQPVGGRWNYDVQNRQPLPKNIVPPPIPQFQHDVELILSMVRKFKLPTIGKCKEGAVWWPINRAQALKMLDDFLKNRLAYFGIYQDAISAQYPFLFHSLLSFPLNTKMISASEVVEAALTFWKENPQQISLAQIEGFVRQIIGWREFMRGVYWYQMPDYEQNNFLGHRLPLPAFYWTGKTRMYCMHKAISQSLEMGYAHHIQRLMITGNFALLAGIDPMEVDEWYLGIYLDAIQWVELPNTRGMSQFADGGLVATKPYVSSANYINKMSDYCQHCEYDPKQRIGARACPFNVLYWDFYHRHRSRLENHPRIGFVYKNLDRMSQNEKENISRQPEVYRQDMENL
ncbi:MAG: cryptochrome/photolyase family protein [Calditrichaeota bacterium]|nr:MAG: cryptochrome/photolyase family protein [Calditrichota bacterium]